MGLLSGASLSVSSAIKPSFRARMKSSSSSTLAAAAPMAIVAGSESPHQVHPGRQILQHAAVYVPIVNRGIKLSLRLHRRIQGQL